MSSQTKTILPYGYKIENRYGLRYLTKNVNRKKHFFNVAQCWGIDKEIFDDLKDEISGIIYKEKEGISYFALVEIVLKHSFIRNFGFGYQLGLPLNHWTTSKVPGIPKSLWTEAPKLPFLEVLR